MELFLKESLKQYFNPRTDLLSQVMLLQGEVFREREGRRTQRIQLGNNFYFLKQHFGIGWKEIFKNLFQFRLPILGAQNERLALERLSRLNILSMTMVGFGKQGRNPATMKSFLLTEELKEMISLEDYCKDWKRQPPSFKIKNQLLNQVASIARTMHNNGINHRDFYICHFLLCLKSLPDLKLYLIDLHRAQIRKTTPLRWIIKDIAGLYFSSKDIGLTSRDVLRFMRVYSNKPLRLILNNEKTLWEQVKIRGDKLYHDHTN